MDYSVNVRLDCLKDTHCDCYIRHVEEASGERACKEAPCPLVSSNFVEAIKHVFIVDFLLSTATYFACSLYLES